MLPKTLSLFALIAAAYSCGKTQQPSSTGPQNPNRKVQCDSPSEVKVSASPAPIAKFDKSIAAVLPDTKHGTDFEIGIQLIQKSLNEPQPSVGGCP
jgi:hypothetical protein